MKKLTPSKEAAVTVATPLASMPPPIISLDPEATVEKQPAPEKEQATKGEPEPQKAKATEEEPAPEKAKATAEQSESHKTKATKEGHAPEKAKVVEETATESQAIVKISEKAVSSKTQETAKSPTSEAIELVVTDIQKSYPLPSAEFSGLLQMLEQAHKVSVLFLHFLVLPVSWGRHGRCYQG